MTFEIVDKAETERSGLRHDDVKWYTHGLQCIGIVLVNTGFGHKAYIGVAPGNDEEADKKLIVDIGTRFHEAPALWPHIERWAS